MLPQVLLKLNLQSPFLVISNSLATSPQGQRYLDFLSAFVVGVKRGVGQNSPIGDAIDIAEQTRQTKYRPLHFIVN